MQKFIEYKQILQQKTVGATHVFIFGGLTTVVNIVVYLIFREGFGFIIKQRM